MAVPLQHQLPLQSPSPIRLTERDKQILEAIHAFDGLLSRQQIDTLFFSGHGRTQPRQRMQALFKHGYVAMPTPEQRHRVPIGEVIYWLNKKGAEVVAGLSGESLLNFTWRKKPRWSLIEHDLKVNDFRIDVSRACDRSPLLSLHQWIMEGEFQANPDTIRYRNGKGEWKSRRVIPDGYFTIRRPYLHGTGESEEFAFFLEIDRATESNPRFAQEKVRAGVAYLQSNNYRQRLGVTYGAYLVVTTGEKRLAHLKHTAERAGGKGLFYFTTFAQVSAATLLTKPIWQIAGSEKAVAVIPDAHIIKQSGDTG